MKINGVLLKDIHELVALLYKKNITTLDIPLVTTPSCEHYESVDEMTSKYCPDCGKKNKVNTTGGPKTVTSYELLDCVSDTNNFTKYYDDYDTMVSSVVSDLHNNEWTLYIGNYEYKLISSFEEGPTCLYIDFDGEYADICSRCYNDDIDIDSQFYISCHNYGYFCSRMIGYIYKNNIDENTECEINHQLVGAINQLEMLVSGKNSVYNYKITEYYHYRCFY